MIHFTQDRNPNWRNSILWKEKTGRINERTFTRLLGMKWHRTTKKRDQINLQTRNHAYLLQILLLIPKSVTNMCKRRKRRKRRRGRRGRRLPKQSQSSKEVNRTRWNRCC